MSLTTKRALADSFEKLLSRRGFDKITVKDIVEDCGVNRQTFYYHFHDIYDLIEWIFQDAADHISPEKRADDGDWTAGIQTLLKFLEDNRMLILNAYNSINHEVVSNYIKRAIRPYAMGIVRMQADAMDTPVSEESIQFVAEIMTLGATGLISEWIGQQMQNKKDMAQKVDRFRTALSGSIQLMLRNLNGAKLPD